MLGESSRGASDRASGPRRTPAVELDRRTGRVTSRGRRRRCAHSVGGVTGVVPAAIPPDSADPHVKEFGRLAPDLHLEQDPADRRSNPRRPSGLHRAAQGCDHGHRRR